VQHPSLSSASEKNDPLIFSAMEGRQHEAEVLAMMRSLYSEDQATSSPDPAKFPLTIAFLLSNPSLGRIMLFLENGNVSGYALLIPYWSNEFGGTLLFVDELFVIRKARNRGIATRFFAFLEQERPFSSVALALEVSPRNLSAHQLYESLGFKIRDNSMLTRRFAMRNDKTET
jgi:GNAT superfamily N-acetyltransferase